MIKKIKVFNEWSWETGINLDAFNKILADSIMQLREEGYDNFYLENVSLSSDATLRLCGFNGELKHCANCNEEHHFVIDHNFIGDEARCEGCN
jgi:hypothetical protein